MRTPTRGLHLLIKVGTLKKIASSGIFLHPTKRFYLITYFTSVNLGGWLVLEPFISPAVFQRYPEAVDEWTLSTLMAADTANGGLNQLEEHYKTFIVRHNPYTQFI